MANEEPTRERSLEPR